MAAMSQKPYEIEGTKNEFSQHAIFYNFSQYFTIFLNGKKRYLKFNLKSELTTQIDFQKFFRN